MKKPKPRPPCRHCTGEILQRSHESIRQWNMRVYCSIECGRSKMRGAPKLTEEQVREIRAAHADGDGSAALAERYDISQSHVINIVQRRTWKEVV